MPDLRAFTFDARIDTDGSIVVPAPLRETLLASGPADVRVIVRASIAPRLAARGIGAAEIARLASVQKIDAEAMEMMLDAAGSLGGTDFPARVAALDRT
jgi:bifunctional DNA-binding transcriptional regulator/antitoxin component of YhaV-PrlF toxin-antitoxin module